MKFRFFIIFFFLVIIDFPTFNAQADSDSNWGAITPSAQSDSNSEWTTVKPPEMSSSPVDPSLKDFCQRAKDKWPELTSRNFSRILMDYDDLKSDFAEAVDKYNLSFPNSPATTVSLSLPSHGSAVTVLPWLFFLDGKYEYTRKFSFFDTEKSLVPVREVWRDPMKAPMGTEPRLVQSIYNFKKRFGRKLTPGDVLLLALSHRRGDLREAFLLAHNTLRSLARAGDNHISGVREDSEVFEDILEPVIATSIADSIPPESNSGAWYHMFGTGFYELQCMRDPIRRPSEWMHGESEEESLKSWIANELEQIWREWQGGNKPDPAKYCFNIWGAQAARMTAKKINSKGRDSDNPSTSKAINVSGPIKTVSMTATYEEGKTTLDGKEAKGNITINNGQFTATFSAQVERPYSKGVMRFTGEASVKISGTVDPSNLQVKNMTVTGNSGLSYEKYNGILGQDYATKEGSNGSASITISKNSGGNSLTVNGNFNAPLDSLIGTSVNLQNKGALTTTGCGITGSFSGELILVQTNNPPT